MIALCRWQQEAREVYVVAQRDPAQWWPGTFSGAQEHQMVWNSSIIGQSLQFPPVIWRFDFRFSLYRLAVQACGT